jgi:hypothetical protein
MAIRWWIGAGMAFVLAVTAGFGERRRNRRSNLDSVGLVDWPTVQFLALMAMVILASIAFNS